MRNAGRRAKGQNAYVTPRSVATNGSSPSARKAAKVVKAKDSDRGAKKKGDVSEPLEGLDFVA